jgi:hypothetical protein
MAGTDFVLSAAAVTAPTTLSQVALRWPWRRDWFAAKHERLATRRELARAGLAAPALARLAARRRPVR